VGTYYRLDGGGDFKPAYPFTIPEAGEHALEFYSEDLEGNREVDQVAAVVVSVDDPAVENLATDTDELFIAGDSLSVRPTSVTAGFNGLVTASRLDAIAEVFRGVFAYPTVSGVPSSPTASTGATVTVGGENVDYYRYRMDGGAWSGEYPVSEAIALTGLSGTVQLAVGGRSQYGDYHPDSEAVEVSWTVDAGAPGIEITGTPATPSRSTGATLNVSGSDYYCYRVDGIYYRPDTGGAAPIVLTRLTDGEHTVEVLPRAGEGGSCPGDVAGTLVRWTVDRLYGLRFPIERRVRHEDLGQVDADFTEYSWDGRTDSGAVVPPGWYSIKISVLDGLERSAGAVKLIYVGDMVAGGMLLSDAGAAGQKEAHAFGKWAVWQDQRYGSWNIFARDLSDETALAVAITNNALNQERPRTDGRFVVWEDRRADGTWDIWAKNLNNNDLMFAVTATADFDERKPAVYWPWVVYQSKPVSDPAAPWQLMAYNLVTTTAEVVDPTGQDQLDPSVHRQRVVWQDFRDPGYGEIYFKDLKTGAVERITDDLGGQYYPVIFDDWIVWADNRSTQFDLYGYNFNRQTEMRLTDTAEDETRPYLNGKWVVYEEDSAGELNINLRLLHLLNLASIQLTNAESQKEKPSMASSTLVWVDLRSGHRQVMAGPLPDLQPVFNNRNTVAVTQGMIDTQADAYTLLGLWNEQAGVTEITRYTSLLPQPVADSVTWSGGGPVGTNFALEAGSFLWVRFNDEKILDLGQSSCTALNLAAGINVFSYACFPDSYSAYRLILELGLTNINAVRALDSDTGRWQVASVRDGGIIGENFRIPTIAVLMLDLPTSIGPWRPGEGP